MSSLLSSRGKWIVREAVARAVKARVRSGETEAAEADRYGVSVETVRRWVSGQGVPAFTCAARIAALVGIDATSGKALPS